MAIENRFNLIDESWIPIVDVGQVSLRQNCSVMQNIVHWVATQCKKSP